MLFLLKTVNLKDVKAWDKPACYLLNVTVRRELVKNYGPFQELYVSSLSEFQTF